MYNYLPYKQRQYMSVSSNLENYKKFLINNTVLNPLPADSFSKYKTKVIPNKVCIIRLYTIKYCIYTCKISAEDESNDSKYTVFNCVKSNYAHFIRNYFSLIILYNTLPP